MASEKIISQEAFGESLAEIVEKNAISEFTLETILKGAEYNAQNAKPEPTLGENESFSRDIEHISFKGLDVGLASISDFGNLSDLQKDDIISQIPLSCGIDLGTTQLTEMQRDAVTAGVDTLIGYEDISGLNFFGLPLTEEQKEKILKHEDLSDVNFRGHNFAGYDFSFEKENSTEEEKKERNLTGTSFYECDLEKAKFSNMNCEKTHFDNAFLHGAIFDNAYIGLASFSGANVTDATFEGVRGLVDSNLQTIHPDGSVSSDVKGFKTGYERAFKDDSDFTGLDTWRNELLRGTPAAKAQRRDTDARDLLGGKLWSDNKKFNQSVLESSSLPVDVIRRVSDATDLYSPIRARTPKQRNLQEFVKESLASSLESPSRGSGSSSLSSSMDGYSSDDDLNDLTKLFQKAGIGSSGLVEDFLVGMDVGDEDPEQTNFADKHKKSNSSVAQGIINEKQAQQRQHGNTFPQKGEGNLEL